MNVELGKPLNAERLFFNAYQSTTGRSEFNLHANHRFTENTGIGFNAHYSENSTIWDDNGDEFVDIPIEVKYSGLLRFFSRPGKFGGQVNLLFARDNHRSGQLEQINQGFGGFEVDRKIDHLEAFGKMFTRQADGNNTGFIWSISKSEFAADYGDRSYNARQTDLYLQMIQHIPLEEDTI